MDARELSHHDGAAAPRGLGRGRRAQTPDVRPVDKIDVERAVLLLRRRLGLEAAPSGARAGALKERAAAPRALGPAS